MPEKIKPKSVANKLRNMMANVQRMSDQFDELCPEEFRNYAAKPPADNNLWNAWKNAGSDLGDLFVSLDELIDELDPPMRFNFDGDVTSDMPNS